MNIDELILVITNCKNGDQLSREQLIQHYRPYILNTASHICKRYISWSDEESSIGLIAFNRAIDTFEQYSGRTFLNYAYLLIQRDLIDFYKREKSEQHLSITFVDSEQSNNMFEIEKSVDSYRRSLTSNELVDEIIEFDHALSEFKVSFEELEKHSPKHKDTRKKLYQLSDVFILDAECKHHFFLKKRLPVSLFSKKTGFSKKTLEKHRKYFISLILLKFNPQWVQLSAYIIDFQGKEEDL
ncbi:RNA polymerase sigma factor [Metabacillus crassostreae]|uniref:RNA polymerase sigma-I factor n=1 Tax=Metabacillus crassostreae TaxID=929098 RepID=UPI0019579432|nr:RNA polymerase sigma-I factor [Metabacillus crassostreae]MBM7603960.1 RNA polymerase sigma factor [Metabacillus crassostreae]